MEREESNESTKFTDETSKEKPTRREDKGASIKKDEQSSEMDDLLDYERDKDVGA